jgi:uncharacterized protein (TIGR00369 family)
MTASLSPPPGYVESRLIDPFEIFVGPVYEKGEPGAKCFLLRIDKRHVNMRGVIHGGMLMTFADLALGQAVWDVTDYAPSVTLNMHTQFLKPARAGEVLEVTPHLIRKTGSLVFMRGDFTVGGETVFTAESVWKLLGKV